jgi:hypothetical protein
MARQAKFGEGVVDAVGQVGDRVNQGSVKVEEGMIKRFAKPSIRMTRLT